MEQSGFTSTKGKLIRSEDGRYYSFVPAYLPIKLDYDDELIHLLSNASGKLGELRSLGLGLEGSIGFDPRLFIRPYLRKEAVLSSKIENTMSTLHEVLEAEELKQFKDEGSRGDLLEVLNYVHAQDLGIKMINEGSAINTDFIMKLHSILLRHVRGEKAKPGALRDSQNYIAKAGFSDIRDAVYVPPPANVVPELLSNLFNYMESSNDLQLIKIALMHYQFEAIHPFLDGNGRIGRLLIIMYMIKSSVLVHPFLYMSDYFERNRDLYYSLLLDVSRAGNYADWIKFFLRGVIEQSDSVMSKAKVLLSYYSEVKEKLGNTATGSAGRLADRLFTHPIITIPSAASALKLSYPSVKKSVAKLMDLGILQKYERSILGAHRRPMMFVAPKIMEIYNA